MLGAEDAAGAEDTDPADKIGGAKTVVFHGPEGDKGAGASEAGLAVHGGAVGVGVHQLNEAFDDVEGRGRTVHEIQVDETDAGLVEDLGLVLWFVEADHLGDFELFENGNVVLGVEGAHLVREPRPATFCFGWAC